MTGTTSFRKALEKSRKRKLRKNREEQKCERKQEKKYAKKIKKNLKIAEHLARKIISKFERKITSGKLETSGQFYSVKVEVKAPDLLVAAQKCEARIRKILLKVYSHKGWESVRVDYLYNDDGVCAELFARKKRVKKK